MGDGDGGLNVDGAQSTVASGSKLVSQLVYTQHPVLLGLFDCKRTVAFKLRRVLLKRSFIQPDGWAELC